MISLSNIQTLYKTGTLMIQSLWKNNINRNQILDPVSCLIRLGMLNFKPEGSKISINENQIKFHESNIYQGFLRWNTGDSRNDLHNLHNPMKKVSEWYDNEIKEMKNIIDTSINGLTKLKESYEVESIIQYTLEHYIEILKSCINNPEKKEKREEIDMNSSILKESIEKELKDSYHIDKENDKENNNIYNELKKLWTFREIKIVNSIFIEMNKQKSNQEQLNAYMKSLDIIVQSKEKQVQNLIEKAYTIL